MLGRLASGEIFGPNTKVILQLLEITPALPTLEGVAMELDDCGFTTLGGLILFGCPQHHPRGAFLLEPLGGRFRQAGAYAAPSNVFIDDQVVDETSRLAQLLPRLRLERRVNVTDDSAGVLSHRHEGIGFVELRAEKPRVTFLDVDIGRHESIAVEAVVHADHDGTEPAERRKIPRLGRADLEVV